MPCDDTEDSETSQPRRKLGGITTNLASDLQDKEQERQIGYARDDQTNGHKWHGMSRRTRLIIRRLKN